jgi:hypothetical protein
MADPTINLDQIIVTPLYTSLAPNARFTHDNIKYRCIYKIAEKSPQQQSEGYMTKRAHITL